MYGGSAHYFASDPVTGNWTRVSNYARNNVNYIPGPITSPWGPSAHTSRLLSKAKGAEWSAPVFFSELGKTAEMVYTAAKRITNMFIALRKGNFRRFVDLWHPRARKRLGTRRSFERSRRRFARQFGRNPREAVASAWLEYKYGWTPFVLDVHNAFELLSELENQPSKKVGRVTSRLEHTYREVSDSPDGLTIVAGLRVGGTMHVSHRLSSRAVWRFSINENANLIGKLGLSNPLSVGWELVPLSFVADWFLPIGDYLAALDAPYRFQHIGGTIGYKQESIANIVRIKPPANWSVSLGSPGGGKRIAVTVNPLTGVPSIKLLDMEFLPNLRHGRVVSAIALLSTAFNKFRH